MKVAMPQSEVRLSCCGKASHLGMAMSSSNCGREFAEQSFFGIACGAIGRWEGLRATMGLLVAAGRNSGSCA